MARDRQTAAAGAYDLSSRPRVKGVKSTLRKMLSDAGIFNDLRIVDPAGNQYNAESNNGQSYYDEDGQTSFGEGVPAAQACIWGLSSSLAQLPRMAGRYTDRALGTWEEFEDHPINPVLAKPVDYLSGWEFWVAFFRSLFVTGNAFAKIVRNRQGFAIGLVPAVGYSRRVKRGRLYGHLLDLQYGRETKHREFVRSSNIFSMHWPAKDPNTGVSLSPIQFAAITATLRSTIRAQKKIADNAPSGMNALYIDPNNMQLPIGVTKQEEALQYVQNGIRRARDSNQMFTIYPGMDLKEVNSIPSSDVQIIEILGLGTRMMAQIFEYPIRRLQHFEMGMKVSELSSQREDYVAVSINTHVSSFESQGTDKLISNTGSETDGSIQIIMPPDILRTGTLKDRLSLMFGVADRGAAKRNELRRAAGLPDLPGQLGEELLSPRGANTGTTNNENQNEEGESTQEQSDGQESENSGEEDGSESENRQQPFSIVQAAKRFNL